MLSLVQVNILLGALFGQKARRETVNQAWRGREETAPTLGNKAM